MNDEGARTRCLEKFNSEFKNRFGLKKVSKLLPYWKLPEERGKCERDGLMVMDENCHCRSWSLVVKVVIDAHFCSSWTDESDPFCTCCGWWFLEFLLELVKGVED